MTPAEHCAHSLKLKIELEIEAKIDLKNELDEIKEARKKRSGGFFACFADIMPIFFGSKEKTKPGEKKKPDEIQAHNGDESDLHTKLLKDDEKEENLHDHHIVEGPETDSDDEVEAKTKPDEKEKKPDEIQAHNAEESDLHTKLLKASEKEENLQDHHIIEIQDHHADEIQAHNADEIKEHDTDHEGIEQTKPQDNNADEKVPRFFKGAKRHDEEIEDDVEFVDVSKYSVEQLEELIGKLSKRLREFPTEKMTNKKKAELIAQCRNSIVNYKFVNHGIEYKYDENNRFSCVLTSMKLAANHNYPEDKFILDEMGEDLIKYFEYHLIVALQFEEYFKMFSTPSLCENHVYKKMLKTQNHSKEETIKDEGDNGSKEDTIKAGGDNH